MESWREEEYYIENYVQKCELYIELFGSGHESYYKIMDISFFWAECELDLLA
jgi:hypothetical protein